MVAVSHGQGWVFNSEEGEELVDVTAELSVESIKERMRADGLGDEEVDKLTKSITRRVEQSGL